MDYLTEYILLLFFTALIHTQTTASEGIIHVPHTCQKFVQLENNGGNDTIKLIVSGNASEWEEHADGRSCDFPIYRNIESYSKKCHRVRVEIQSLDDNDFDRCHFDVHLYAGEKASNQQIKSLSCHHNTSVTLDLPSPRIIASLTPTKCATGAGSTLEHTRGNVDVKITLLTDDECRQDIEEKETSFQKASCGRHGCLDNSHHGYSIYAESTETRFCWFNVTLHRSRQLCLKQHFENEHRWRSCKTKRWHAEIFINGFQMMKFGCDDMHNWWCLPWNVDGHIVSFRWQQNWQSCNSENYVRVISLSDHTKTQTCGLNHHPSLTGATPKVAPDVVEKEKYTVIIVIISLPLLFLIGFLLAIRMLVDKMKRRQDLRNQNSECPRRLSSISQTNSPPPYPGKLSKTNVNYLPSYQSALDLPYFTSSYDPVLPTAGSTGIQFASCSSKSANAREIVTETLNIPSTLITNRNFNMYDGNSIRANFIIGDEIPMNSNNDDIAHNSVLFRYSSEPNNSNITIISNVTESRSHSNNSSGSDIQERIAVVQTTLDSDIERASNSDESTDSDDKIAYEDDESTDDIKE